MDFLAKPVALKMGMGQTPATTAKLGETPAESSPGDWTSASRSTLARKGTTARHKAESLADHKPESPVLPVSNLVGAFNEADSETFSPAWRPTLLPPAPMGSLDLISSQRDHMLDFATSSRMGGAATIPFTPLSFVGQDLAAQRMACAMSAAQQLHHSGFAGYPQSETMAWLGCADGAADVGMLVSRTPTPAHRPGEFLDKARDQAGCRQLQDQLTSASPATVSAIFEDILSEIVELMEDTFGNYLAQKLMEVISSEERGILVDRVLPSITSIARNSHGTRSVQKLVETVSTPDQIARFEAALRPETLSLLLDPNASHVVQRCLHYWPPHHTRFIFDTMVHNCREVAMDRSGCCVLQKYLGKDISPQHQARMLAQEVVRHALELVVDPFGNYVLQTVISKEFDQVNEQIVDTLQFCLRELAMQKFSSHVFQTLLKHLHHPNAVDKMVRPFTDPRHVVMLLTDQYANYVMQTVIDKASGRLLDEMLASIQQCIPALRTSDAGRKILSKIVSRFPELSDGTDIRNDPRPRRGGFQNRRGNQPRYGRR